MATDLPDEYAWLYDEPGPPQIAEFIAIHGVNEVPGPGNNPEILAWARELGVQKVYTADKIPFCGLGAGVVYKRAGFEIPKTPLWALSWAEVYDSVEDDAMLGDVLTFKRDGGGHVGMYVGEDETAYHVFGSNQSDGTNITRIAHDRLYAARRPRYKTPYPNIRQVFLSAQGALSTNEA